MIIMIIIFTFNNLIGIVSVHYIFFLFLIINTPLLYSKNKN